MNIFCRSETIGARHARHGRCVRPRHPRGCGGAQASQAVPCCECGASGRRFGGVPTGFAAVHRCPGSLDDLGHYASCHRQWAPILSGLGMAPQPSWEQHLGLVGDLGRRVASVRAWLAAFRSYLIVRHGDGAPFRDAAVAAVDHARVRVPANVGAAARPKARTRARARASVWRTRVSVPS